MTAAGAVYATAKRPADTTEAEKQKRGSGKEQRPLAAPGMKFRRDGREKHAVAVGQAKSHEQGDQRQPASQPATTGVGLLRCFHADRGIAS